MEITGVKNHYVHNFYSDSMWRVYRNTEFYTKLKNANKKKKK